MNFLKKVYDFFASPNTPGSGFYMALVPLISSVGDYFIGSGNPVLMGIGGGIAAVYAAAHAIGQGIAQKQPAPAVNIPIATGAPTVNDTPFGVPKVGPDTVPLAEHVALIQKLQQAQDLLRQMPDPYADSTESAKSTPTAADMSLGQPQEPQAAPQDAQQPQATPAEAPAHPQAFWNQVAGEAAPPKTGT